jgi:hypothetical protein
MEARIVMMQNEDEKSSIDRRVAGKRGKAHLKFDQIIEPGMIMERKGHFHTSHLCGGRTKYGCRSKGR